MSVRFFGGGSSSSSFRALSLLPSASVCLGLRAASLPPFGAQPGRKAAVPDDRATAWLCAPLCKAGEKRNFAALFRTCQADIPPSRAPAVPPPPPSLPAPPCRVVSAGRRAGSAPYCYFRDLFFFLGRFRPFLTNCLCAYVKLFRLSCSTCEALRNFPRIRFRPDVDISRRQRLVRAV